MWRRSSRRRQGLSDKESEWTDSPDLSSHKFERSILRPLVRTPMDENGKDRRWDSLYSTSRTRSSGRSSDSLMCKRHRSLPRVTRTISGDTSPEQKVLLDLQSFITSQQHLLEKAEWGDNTRAVKFYLRCQRQQHKSIVQFGRDIDKAGSMVDTIPTHLKKAFQDDFERISEQYNNLLPLSNQRLTSMEQLAWFSSQAERLILWLEEKEKHEVNYDWSQSNIRRKRDAYLGLLQDLEKQEVELTVVQKEGEKLLNLFHPAVHTIEEILFEVEKKWRWVLQLCHCIFSHVQENTAYWQFFRDAHAAEKLLRELHKLIKMMMVHPPGPHKTLRKQIQGIQERIEEMEVIVQSLSNKSTEIVQLKPRCPDNLIASLLPLKAVCDYTLNGMLVCQREHVYLLKDNKHRVSWLVLLPGGVEIIVPSVCYTILPPNKHAINISNRIQEMLTETKIYWIKCSADLNIIQLWYLLHERMSRVTSWTIEEVEQQNHNDLQEVMDKVEKLYNKLLESRSETGILQTWHYEQMNEDMSTCRRIYKNLIISLGQTNSIPRAWRERSIRLSIERRSQSSSTSMSPEPYSFWDKSPRLQSPLFNEGRMLQRAGTLPASRELSPTMQYWGKSSPKYTSDDDVFSPEPPHKLARNSMTPTARKAQGQGKVPTNLDTVRLAMDQMKDVMETPQLQRQAAVQGSQGDLATAEQGASNLKQMHEEPRDGVIVDPGLKNEAWEEQHLHKETHLSNEEECLEAQLEILRGSVEEARAGQERAETEAVLHQAHSDELHQKILQVEHKVQKLEASERDALKSRQEALQEAERLKQEAEMAYQREHLGNGEVGYENQAEAVKLQEEVKQTRMELAQFEAQLQQQLERAATYQELAQQEARAKEVAQAEAMSLWRSAEKEAELRKAAEVEAQELGVVVMKEMERYRFAAHEAEEARKKLQEELCRLHIEVKSTSREKASLEEQQIALRADASHMRIEKDQTLAELCLLKAKMEAMMKQCPKESSFCEDFIDELLEKEVEEPSIWTAKSEVAFTPPSQEKEIECTFPIAITTHPESTSIPSCHDQGLSQKPPCPDQGLSLNPPHFDEELSLKPLSSDQVLSLKSPSSNEELSLKPTFPNQELSLNPPYSDELSLKPPCANQELSPKPPYPDQKLSRKPPLPNQELSLKPFCCDQELSLKSPCSNEELSLKSLYPDLELSLKPPLPNHELSLKPSCCNQELSLKFLHSNDELSLKSPYPDQELSLKPPGSDEELSLKPPYPDQGLYLKPVCPDQELFLKPPCADQDLSLKLPCPNQGLCLNYSMVSSMENSSDSTSRSSQDDSPAFTSSDVHHKVNDLPEVQKAGRCDILALDKMTTEHVEMKECKEHAEQLGERTLSLPWELVDNGLKLNTHKKSHISFRSLSSTPSPAVEKTCCITNSKIYEKNDQHVTCRKLETGDQHGLDVQHEENWHIRPCLQEGLETEYNERHFEIDDDSLRHIMQTNQEACGDPTKEKEILACTLKRTKEQGIRFIGETVEEGNCRTVCRTLGNTDYDDVENNLKASDKKSSGSLSEDESQWEETKSETLTIYPVDIMKSDKQGQSTKDEENDDAPSMSLQTISNSLKASTEDLGNSTTQSLCDDENENVLSRNDMMTVETDERNKTSFQKTKSQTIQVDENKAPQKPVAQEKHLENDVITFTLPNEGKMLNSGIQQIRVDMEFDNMSNVTKQNSQTLEDKELSHQTKGVYRDNIVNKYKQQSNSITFICKSGKQQNSNLGEPRIEELSETSLSQTGSSNATADEDTKVVDEKIQNLHLGGSDSSDQLQDKDNKESNIDYAALSNVKYHKGEKSHLRDEPGKGEFKDAFDLKSMICEYQESFITLGRKESRNLPLEPKCEVDCDVRVFKGRQCSDSMAINEIEKDKQEDKVDGKTNPLEIPPDDEGKEQAFSTEEQFSCDGIVSASIYEKTRTRAHVHAGERTHNLEQACQEDTGIFTEPDPHLKMATMEGQTGDVDIQEKTLHQMKYKLGVTERTNGHPRDETPSREMQVSLDSESNMDLCQGDHKAKERHLEHTIHDDDDDDETKLYSTNDIKPRKKMPFTIVVYEDLICSEAETYYSAGGDSVTRDDVFRSSEQENVSDSHEVPGFTSFEEDNFLSEQAHASCAMSDHVQGEVRVKNEHSEGNAGTYKDPLVQISLNEASGNKESISFHDYEHQRSINKDRGDTSVSGTAVETSLLNEGKAQYVHEHEVSEEFHHGTPMQERQRTVRTMESIFDKEGDSAVEPRSTSSAKEGDSAVEPRSTSSAKEGDSAVESRSTSSDKEAGSGMEPRSTLSVTDEETRVTNYSTLDHAHEISVPQIPQHDNTRNIAFSLQAERETEIGENSEKQIDYCENKGKFATVKGKQEFTYEEGVTASDSLSKKHRFQSPEEPVKGMKEEHETSSESTRRHEGKGPLEHVKATSSIRLESQDMSNCITSRPIKDGSQSENLTFPGHIQEMKLTDGNKAQRKAEDRSVTANSPEGMNDALGNPVEPNVLSHHTVTRHENDLHGRDDDARKSPFNDRRILYHLTSHSFVKLNEDADDHMTDASKSRNSNSQSHFREGIERCFSESVPVQVKKTESIFQAVSSEVVDDPDISKEPLIPSPDLRRGKGRKKGPDVSETVVDKTGVFVPAKGSAAVIIQDPPIKHSAAMSEKTTLTAPDRLEDRNNPWDSSEPEEGTETRTRVTTDVERRGELSSEGLIDNVIGKTVYAPNTCLVIETLTHDATEIHVQANKSEQLTSYVIHTSRDDKALMDSCNTTTPIKIGLDSLGTPDEQCTYSEEESRVDTHPLSHQEECSDGEELVHRKETTVIREYSEPPNPPSDDGTATTHGLACNENKSSMNRPQGDQNTSFLVNFGAENNLHGFNEKAGERKETEELRITACMASRPNRKDEEKLTNKPEATPTQNERKSQQAEIKATILTLSEDEDDDVEREKSFDGSKMVETELHKGSTPLASLACSTGATSRASDAVNDAETPQAETGNKRCSQKRPDALLSEMNVEVNENNYRENSDASACISNSYGDGRGSPDSSQVAHRGHNPVLSAQHTTSLIHQSNKRGKWWKTDNLDQDEGIKYSVKGRPIGNKVHKESMQSVVHTERSSSTMSEEKCTNPDFFNSTERREVRSEDTRGSFKASREANTRYVQEEISRIKAEIENITCNVDQSTQTNTSLCKNISKQGSDISPGPLIQSKMNESSTQKASHARVFTNKSFGMHGAHEAYLKGVGKRPQASYSQGAGMSKFASSDKVLGKSTSQTHPSEVVFQGLRAPISINQLESAHLIDCTTADQLREGRLSPGKISLQLSSYLKGSRVIAGIIIEKTRECLSVHEAMQRKVVRPGCALQLLEAQAATGFIIEPVSGRKLSVTCATWLGMVAPKFYEKLLSAEGAVTGYLNPKTSEHVSLFEALRLGIILPSHGMRLLEAQLATGGLIDPAASHRLPLSVALARGLIDADVHRSLCNPNNDCKGFFDPNTDENLTYAELQKRCVHDHIRNLLLLPLHSK